MIASKILSQLVPLLKREDDCAQALGWMEIFRVSQLPVVEGEDYIGLLADETIYAHGNQDDAVAVLDIPRDGTYVFEDTHIYDIIELASSRLLSVVPVLSRNGKYRGAILLTDILHLMDRLLGVHVPGGIIVLEVNKIDYSLAEVAQIVEYNEAKVLSCYVTENSDSNKVNVTLKVNTVEIERILDTFIRYRYVITHTFVTGEGLGEELKDRFGQFIKYLEM